MLIALLALTMNLYATPSSHEVGLDEVLSYECARKVADLVPSGDLPGPVFHQHGLVFTSTVASNGTPVLVITAGAGVYSLRLKQGVNRLRLAVPAQGKLKPTVYFMSFAHGDGHRSRVFEFGVHRPPAGKEEIDFIAATPYRSENMLQHLEYAVYQTADNLADALTEGRLERELFNATSAAACDHLQRRTPNLARSLRRSLDLIETMVVGVRPRKTAASTRMPASVPN